MHKVSGVSKEHIKACGGQMLTRRGEAHSSAVLLSSCTTLMIADGLMSVSRSFIPVPGSPVAPLCPAVCPAGSQRITRPPDWPLSLSRQMEGGGDNPGQQRHHYGVNRPPPPFPLNPQKQRWHAAPRRRITGDKRDMGWGGG
ncbi:unnamed protein product [Gadus morhua 'NCC']